MHFLPISTFPLILSSGLISESIEFGDRRSHKQLMFSHPVAGSSRVKTHVTTSPQRVTPDNRHGDSIVVLTWSARKSCG
ncbi:hypothetical protein EV424DRAFT_738698 [Suillus variegatus]|nr:hypothetical protein EV424DRAFT_738698 [Suillus variegatus]